MRTLVLVTALAAVGSGLTIRHLTEEAQAAPAPASVTGPALDAQAVHGIALDGGRNLPSAALRAVVSTKVGDSLDEQRLENAQRYIRRTGAKGVILGRWTAALRALAASFPVSEPQKEEA